MFARFFTVVCVVMYHVSNIRLLFAYVCYVHIVITSSLPSTCVLQDINKWLDDTPRFSEFSSASNSPSHLIGAEEYDVVRSRIESEYRHSLKLDRDRPSSGTSSRSNKDGKVRKGLWRSCSSGTHYKYWCITKFARFLDVCFRSITLCSGILFWYHVTGGIAVYQIPSIIKFDALKPGCCRMGTLGLKGANGHSIFGYTFVSATVI